MVERAERRRARLEAERRRRRRTKRQRRRGRRWLAIVLVVAVAGAVVVAAWARGRGDDGGTDDAGALLGREGSTTVPGAPDVAIERTPPSLRVVYRVETAGESVSVVTDTLTSRRPFDSRLETLSGPPPGSGTPSARVGWFLGTATTAGGNDPLIIEVAPGAPPTDLRLEHVAREALARDLLLRREVREVLDRRCQVYRSRDTLAAPIRPPEARDHVDTCVDAAGIVLEEVVTVDGDALTRRVAVEVEEGPQNIDDGLFRVEGAPLPAESGGGFVRKLKDGSSPPGEFFVADRPPMGFEYRGRYSVVPAQPENFGEDPSRESFRRAGTVDLWLRGTDVVTLDQGGTLRGAAPFEPVAGAPRIDVPPFGEGELLLSGAATELRVVLDGGRYVRVAGTAPVDELLALAAGLRATPGGTLEFEE